MGEISKLIQEADFQSCLSEWKLDRAIFQSICKIFWIPYINPFV